MTHTQSVAALPYAMTHTHMVVPRYAEVPRAPNPHDLAGLSNQDLQDLLGRYRSIVTAFDSSEYGMLSAQAAIEKLATSVREIELIRAEMDDRREAELSLHSPTNDYQVLWSHDGATWVASGSPPHPFDDDNVTPR